MPGLSDHTCIEVQLDDGVSYLFYFLGLGEASSIDMANFKEFILWLVGGMMIEEGGYSIIKVQAHDWDFFLNH